MTTIKKNVKPAELGVPVEGIHQGVKRVVIKCVDRAGLGAISEAITKKNLNLKIRQPEPLRAVLTINGVDEEECGDSFVRSLYQTNIWLRDIRGWDRQGKDVPIVAVRFARMATSKHQKRVYLLVNGDARKVLNERGRVHVGFRSLRVVDNTPLLQCFKCLAFGHTSAKCGGALWILRWSAPH